MPQIHPTALTINLGTTQCDIQLQLAKDDEADTARGILPPHNITPSTFLNTGLDLEE
jgi:hypothetical protein